MTSEAIPCSSVQRTNEILVPDTNSVLGETGEKGQRTVSMSKKVKVEDDQTDVPAIFAEWKRQEDWDGNFKSRFQRKNNIEPEVVVNESPVKWCAAFGRCCPQGKRLKRVYLMLRQRKQAYNASYARKSILR